MERLGKTNKDPRIVRAFTRGLSSTPLAPFAIAVPAAIVAVHPRLAYAQESLKVEECTVSATFHAPQGSRELLDHHQHTTRCTLFCQRN